MFLQVYDQNVNQIGVIDVFTSLIWTKRYNSPGDFEVIIPLDGEIPDFLVNWTLYDDLDYYVTLSEDREPGYYMIIETMEVEDEEEGGTTLTITGRSLEILLERRIVWTKIVYISKKTENINKDLLEKNIIKPSLAERKIENFVYEEPEEDLYFSSIDVEYDGESLLEVMESHCSENYHSISVRYLNGKFIYKTYSGKNRSHDQTEVDEVLYSKSFDSLASSKYLESVKKYKNVIQVINSLPSASVDGEESQDEQRQEFVLGNISGISRRECRENVQNVENKSSLKSIANIILYENSKIAILEANTINDVYIYGIDIFVGDIVQFKSDYGIERKARIIEYIYSEDISGINNYPTFEVIGQKG